MKIQNTTDISNKRIRQMMDFVKPNGIASKFTVRVTNGSTEYDGRPIQKGFEVGLKNQKTAIDLM